MLDRYEGKPGAHRGAASARRYVIAAIACALLAGACAEKRTRRTRDDECQDTEEERARLAVRVKELEAKISVAQDAQKKAELQLKLVEATCDHSAPPERPPPKPSGPPRACNCKAEDPLCDCL